MILVTGASGFLGGAIASALASRAASSNGNRVRGLVRKTSDDKRLASLDRLDVERAEGDLFDERSLDNAMKGVRVVYHAAGMLGQPGVPESAYMRIHVDGTLAVIRAAERANVERIVYVSSPGLLGPIDPPRPPADEDAAPNPTNPYERSKAAAEQAIASLEPSRRARIVTVRPEFVYGPGDTHVARLVRSIQRRAFFYIGDGSALCHPTFASDALSGILAAGDRGKGDRTYHIAGPRPVTIRAFSEAFAKALGVSPPRLSIPESPIRFAVSLAERLGRKLNVKPPLTTSGVDFFTMNRQFSTKRAQTELSWSPVIDIEEGAARAVVWYREKGHIE